jgi:predicted ATPase
MVTIHHRDLARVTFSRWEKVPDRADEGISNNIASLFIYLSHHVTMRYCGGVTEAVKQAIAQYRYNSMVFLFPPWSEIYCHDTERKQTFQEAIETWVAVKKGYADSGYLTIDVPKLSVEERVEPVKCCKFEMIN